ncbi:hypothetical protein Elgi_38330 [Paenibacillus elgii]|uniref:hypothetical protein n=1 Tax=Paenibacillus elgii TaxID=189691 RepID=UPI002D7AA80E|nr:hypothetical protein Elgi_38330 [Paenibacillus elgii]
MGKYRDLTGQKFDRLTVVKYIGRNKINRGAIWLCECCCENKTKIEVEARRLKAGTKKSCGCLQRESITKHNLSRTRIYKIHKSMMDRCNNPNSKTNYDNYGARGIRVCEEWLGDEGFINFYKWSLENGYDDLLTLDRKDVNGNYEPENCRWATKKEQGNNRRDNTLIKHNGEVKTLSQWAEKAGLHISTLLNRIKRGGDLAVILSTPPQKAKKQSNIKGIIWAERYQKWHLLIRENKKRKHVGYYVNLEDAIKAKDMYLKIREVNNNGTGKM